MWTYLTIFASIFTLVVVFLRRIILTIRKGDQAPIDQTSFFEEMGKEEGKKEKKKRVTRDQKSQVNELRDKAERMIKMGKEEDAIKYFIQALAVNERDIETLHKLGMLYMKKQMFSPAAALFKQLVSFKEDALHYSHLALSLYHQGDLEGAKFAYQKAVELDTKRPQRFVSLCQVYRGLSYPEAAIIAVNKAIELAPENLDFMVLQADLLLEIEDYHQVELILKKIFDLEPENPGAKVVFEDLKKIKREQAKENDKKKGRGK